MSLSPAKKAQFESLLDTFFKPTLLAQMISTITPLHVKTVDLATREGRDTLNEQLDSIEGQPNPHSSKLEQLSASIMEIGDPAHMHTLGAERKINVVLGFLDLIAGDYAQALAIIERGSSVGTLERFIQDRCNSKGVFASDQESK